MELHKLHPAKLEKEISVGVKQKSSGRACWENVGQGNGNQYLGELIGGANLSVLIGSRFQPARWDSTSTAFLNVFILMLCKEES